MVSLTALNRARSFASVIEMVIVVCLAALQLMAPPNKIITYPLKHFLVFGLFPNEASLVIIKC